ncbi:hypothetical protein BLA29_011102, partial [Euroglyphus maynei]
CINANANGLWPNHVAVANANQNRAIIGRANHSYPSHQQRAAAATMAINDAFDYDSHEDSAGRHDDDAALIRSGIFALFYTLPALCVLSTYIYEYLYRQQWLLRQTDTTIITSTATNLVNSPPIIESLETNRPNFEIFNMRLFMSLVIGIKTGIWILTARSPITALRCVITRCMTKKVFPVNTIHGHTNPISRTLPPQQQQQQQIKQNPTSQILYNDGHQTRHQ